MGKKTRVFQMARELKISSEALMHIIESLGLDADVKSHMSSVGEDVVAKVKDHIAHEREVVKEAQRRKVRFHDGEQRTATQVAPPPTPAPPAPPPEAPPTPRAPKVEPPAPPRPRDTVPKPPSTRTPAPAPPRRPARPSTPQAPRPAPRSRPTTAPAPKRMPSRAPTASGASSSAAPPRTGAPAGRPRPVEPARGYRPRPKGKKRKSAVDQKLVRDSVRKTLATMETGARRKSKKRRREDAQQVDQEVQKVQIEEFATVAELAGAMDVKPGQVIAACLQLGIIANINRRLDRDSIETLADEFGYEVEFTDHMAAEETETEAELDVPWETRAPIVTVMGHVDHGKTSLLDYIRKSDVAAGESGAITQHIGAYHVTTDQGGHIVFLDTPGHEAFTAMRARGVQTTDLVVLVVAADDRVNEQTVEAINHARAASVPIIVAINKCDLPNANPDKIKKELSEQNILVEEWGGKNVAVEISAKTGQNVDKLFEMIILVSELQELKAQPARPARGVVIEAKREKGRGVVGTVLVQTGTLHVGDYFVCGSEWGRVRAMHDDHGQVVKEAPPATPVEVLGWSGMPMAGDIFRATKSDDEAREIATKRSQIQREYELRQKRPSLESVQERIRQGEVAELRVILKGDVAGSVEVFKDQLEQQSTEKVTLRIVHSAVGNINESDVHLAVASEAIIIGFHVRPEAKAKAVAEDQKVDIRLYDVIHEVISDMRDAMAGKLKPKEVEKVVGEAEVRQIFKISRFGNIAGSFVLSGTMLRSSRARVLRDGEQVWAGRIKSLKRFKDDVKEVTSGFECGITLDGFDDFQENDKILAYEVEEVADVL